MPITTTPAWRSGLSMACAAVFAATVGAAQAQTAPAPPAAAGVGPATPSADLSWLRVPADDRSRAGEDLRAVGIARTSVDHRFAGRLLGQVGFLCGLHSGVGDDDGAVAMRGADPQGKFLGAKLSLAFK